MEWKIDFFLGSSADSERKLHIDFLQHWWSGKDFHVLIRSWCLGSVCLSVDRCSGLNCFWWAMTWRGHAPAALNYYLLWFDFQTFQMCAVCSLLMRHDSVLGGLFISYMLNVKFKKKEIKINLNEKSTVWFLLMQLIIQKWFISSTTNWLISYV